LEREGPKSETGDRPYSDVMADLVTRLGVPYGSVGHSQGSQEDRRQRFRYLVSRVDRHGESQGNTWRTNIPGVSLYFDEKYAGDQMIERYGDIEAFRAGNPDQQLALMRDAIEAYQLEYTAQGAFILSPEALKAAVFSPPLEVHDTNRDYGDLKKWIKVNPHLFVKYFGPNHLINTNTVLGQRVMGVMHHMLEDYQGALAEAKKLGVYDEVVALLRASHM
jgi:hypothetical protein